MRKRELLNNLGTRKKMFEDYLKQVRRQRPARHNGTARSKLPVKA